MKSFKEHLTIVQESVESDVRDYYIQAIENMFKDVKGTNDELYARTRITEIADIEDGADTTLAQFIKKVKELDTQLLKKIYSGLKSKYKNHKA